jgi:transcriptional regulator with PAS, ATPase and Fis domain
MRSAYALLERAGSTTATVLLTGETGTGKDLAARAIHDLSVRAAGPFVPVDCSAIPEHLFESELFGHVRGAFTGAVASRRGVFEEANGGTLFLDEIGELPLALQAKLLRALETRTIRRVGASLPTPVDVRIIAATNRALLKQVNSGAFREDLYYRLAVLEIELPPLRDRRDDLPLLAQTLWARCGGTGDIPDHVVQHLCARDYPGNVRELRNHVERLVVLGLARRPGVTAVMAVAEERAGPATASSSAPLPPLHLPLKEARHAWMRGFEEIYVRAMFERHGGNLTHAAAAAGISRRSLQRIVIRLGLRGAEDEPDD